MNEEKLKEREEEIIQYIKKNPNCTLDSIYTKGRIPKSKVTRELFEKLLEEGKIHARNPNKKRFLVDEEHDFVTELVYLAKDIEEDMKIHPQYDTKKTRKFLEFLKLRVKVLTAEGKKSNDVNIEDTLRIMNLTFGYNKNPNKLLEYVVLDALNWAIRDDTYYLSHQLRSNPTNRKKEFHKATVGKRRSIEDLLNMKKKGAREYGLRGKDFRKNMKRLTKDPSIWLDRFYAEENRTFYQNPPELHYELYKKMLETAKLTPDMPDYEIRKKLLDAQREAFPNMDVAILCDIMPEKAKERLRKEFKEMGWDYDLLDKLLLELKTIEYFKQPEKK